MLLSATSALPSPLKLLMSLALWRIYRVAIIDKSGRDTDKSGLYEGASIFTYFPTYHVRATRALPLVAYFSTEDHEPFHHFSLVVFLCAFLISSDTKRTQEREVHRHIVTIPVR